MGVGSAGKIMAMAPLLLFGLIICLVLIGLSIKFWVDFSDEIQRKENENLNLNFKLAISLMIIGIILAIVVGKVGKDYLK